MADSRATPELEANNLNGDNETENDSPPYSPLETLAAIAVAVSSPAAAPATAPPTVDTDQPTVETVEDIAITTDRNTGDPVQPAPPHPSASVHGPATSAALAYLQRDPVLSRTVHHHSPYLPEIPNQLFGQVWIDHIDSMLGVRTQTQAEEMRYCVGQVDRVIHLANNILRQQRELLADVRRIVGEEYRSGDDSSELSNVNQFGDEAGDNGDGDGTAVNGRTAASG